MIYIELLIGFLKVGLFSFGGAYAAIPLIRDVVLSYGWIDEEKLSYMIGVSESTPGPIMVNIATYVGTEQVGFFGAFFATLGVVLPSFIIILIVAKCYEKFQSSKIVMGCMSGLKPCVVGLIGAAVINIAASVLFPAGITLYAFSGVNLYISLAIFAVMAVLAFKKVHPILIIVLSAVIGIAVGYGLNLKV